MFKIVLFAPAVSMSRRDHTCSTENAPPGMASSTMKNMEFNPRGWRNRSLISAETEFPNDPE